MSEPDSSEVLSMKANLSAPERVKIGARLLFGSIIGAAILALALWEIFH